MLRLSTMVGLRHESAPAELSSAPKATAGPLVENPNNADKPFTRPILTAPASTTQVTVASQLLALRADPERMLRRAKDVEAQEAQRAPKETEVAKVSAVDSDHEDGREGSSNLPTNEEDEEDQHDDVPPKHARTRCRVRRRRRAKPAL